MRVIIYNGNSSPMEVKSVRHPHSPHPLPIYDPTGDWDACVPFTDNAAWTSHTAKANGWRVAKPWHPWSYPFQPYAGHTETSQVGGYATSYTVGNEENGEPSGFSFITIRGGRHEVPETAPQRAFEMLNKMFLGKDF